MEAASEVTNQTVTSEHDTFSSGTSFVNPENSTTAAPEITTEYPDASFASDFSSSRPESGSTAASRTVSRLELSSESAATSSPGSEWRSTSAPSRASDPESTHTPSTSSSPSSSPSSWNPESSTSVSSSSASSSTTGSILTSESSSAKTTHRFVESTSSQFQTRTEDYPVTTVLDQSGSGLSQGAIIGISVSVCLVVLIVIVLVLVVLQNRKKNKKSKYHRDGDNPNDYKLDIRKGNPISEQSSPGVKTTLFDLQLPDQQSVEEGNPSEVNDNDTFNIDDAVAVVKLRNGIGDDMRNQDNRMSLGPIVLGADNPEMSKQMLSEMSTTNTFKR